MGSICTTAFEIESTMAINKSNFFTNKKATETLYRRAKAVKYLFLKTLRKNDGVLKKPIIILLIIYYKNKANI